ncbi:uncharacterized protein C3orf26 homolog [Impatiens glandulifera]|uniref:uncharacterized protein C3orf26 homolog n=1 Tax=Impatiens glandulifera TaxID=253017 RepID=UPI001FB0C685|nr:uncharacterized protein C3orf26 homolog [Impatiens glandulifera]
MAKHGRGGKQDSKMSRGSRNRTGFKKSTKDRNPLAAKKANKPKGKFSRKSTTKKKPVEAVVDIEKVKTVKKQRFIIPQLTTVSQQFDFFIDQYQTANRVQLSPLELESITGDTAMVQLSPGVDQSASNLGQHMKYAFGSSWKELLCGKEVVEGQIDVGSPSLLVISLSALRSLELFRGVHSLTRECPAAKLFSKHIKVEEQVSFLKKRVNIAVGTPNRIKKLIDMEALGVNKVKVVVLDMQTDVKGFSLFSLAQVRDEFWDLYKSCFHQRFLQNDIRICLYDPVSSDSQKESS